jgi:hypothetical protein
LTNVKKAAQKRGYVFGMDRPSLNISDRIHILDIGSAPQLMNVPQDLFEEFMTSSAAFRGYVFRAYCGQFITLSAAIADTVAGLSPAQTDKTRTGDRLES